MGSTYSWAIKCLLACLKVLVGVKCLKDGSREGNLQCPRFHKEFDVDVEMDIEIDRDLGPWTLEEYSCFPTMS